MAHLQLSSAPRSACFVKQRSAQAPRRAAAAVRCSGGSSGVGEPGDAESRRGLLAGLGAGAVALVLAPGPATALPGFKKDMTSKRRQTVPESEYKEGPEGLKYYDVIVGDGDEAQLGKRVVIHFECKWKGITFITSRQGMGVTGGSPLGFDVGAHGAGGTLKGLDLGVRGMRVGGRRKLKVPPALGYGDKGVGEIPPGATLDFDLELLSIKKDARGYQVKLVEG